MRRYQLRWHRVSVSTQQRLSLKSFRGYNQLNGLLVRLVVLVVLVVSVRVQTPPRGRARTRSCMRGIPALQSRGTRRKPEPTRCIPNNKELLGRGRPRRLPSSSSGRLGTRRGLKIAQNHSNEPRTNPPSRVSKCREFSELWPGGVETKKYAGPKKVRP